MNIDCIADLHGYLPKIESGGDVLIVAGDSTLTGSVSEWRDFIWWLEAQQHKKIIVVAGNHDRFLEIDNGVSVFGYDNDANNRIVYLQDSGTQFEGFKIWGSPWTPLFHGVNPECRAFMDNEKAIGLKFDLIPKDTDILITHGPPLGCLDEAKKRDQWGYWNAKKSEMQSVGSYSLRNRVLGNIYPKLWVFGHIHESYGIYEEKIYPGPPYLFVNCSHVNSEYEPVNKPIRIEL